MWKFNLSNNDFTITLFLFTFGWWKDIPFYYKVYEEFMMWMLIISYKNIWLFYNGGRQMDAAAVKWQPA